MAEIKPMALIENMKKKVCEHSDVYFRTNKQTEKVTTGKMCNPSTKEPSAAQIAAKARFKKVQAEESENASVQDDISFSAMKRRESKPASSRYNRPSHLLVTPNTYNVLLPDFDTEIHFTTQVKALYILFLNHPEGIRLVDIADHKKEYTNIYMNVTTRSDVDKRRAKVLLFYDMTK